MLNRVKELPKGFVWGAATAAFQVEGATSIEGKGKTMWDDYLIEQGRFLPDPACDFYHRYEEDVKLAKESGLDALRISIAWSRIFPDGTGEPNPLGVDYYHRVFAACHENSIEPYVTLHHFDSPKAIFDKGDWLNRENIEAFVYYAEYCFKEFSEVENWFTINELFALAMGQYITGIFPPCHHFDVTSAIQAQHNELLAHAKAVNRFKELGIPGKIGLIHSLHPVYPLTDSEEDKHAAKLTDAFRNRFLLDGSFLGYYSEDTMEAINEILSLNDAELEILPGDLDILARAAIQNDYFGLNYYQNDFVKSYEGESGNTFNGTGEKGTSSALRFKGMGQIVKKPGIPTTDWDWNIVPQGMYDILKDVSDSYPNCPTIYVTENGLGYKDVLKTDGTVCDDERIDFIDQHVAAILQARADGVDVEGYFVWSLQDQFSWANGYNKRYGLVYIDFDTQKRYLKKSAFWFKKLSDTRS